MHGEVGRKIEISNCGVLPPNAPIGVPGVEELSDAPDMVSKFRYEKPREYKFNFFKERFQPESQIVQIAYNVKGKPD